MTANMNRGFICFVILGLSCVLHAADVNYDNVASDTKDISKISTYHNTLDKRGAVKLSNTDSPSFNHLASSNIGGSTVTTAGVSNTVGYKVASTSTSTSNQTPYKYLYNQYYHANPYFTYVQMPQAAAQIASQYAFQSNPVAHYLQTPNQIQYVSAPTFAQVTPVKYQTLSNEYSNAGTETSSASAATAQYTSPSHQSLISSSQSYTPSGSSATQASTSATSATLQSKPVQVPFYPGYQTAQPVYYTQQPLLTFYVQPHANPTNYVYQQPAVAANYLFKQQQQPLLNFYGANRFGFYSPVQTSQVNYLAPQVETTGVQDATKTTTADLKSSDKTLATSQHSSGSSGSYLYSTKA